MEGMARCIWDLKAATHTQVSCNQRGQNASQPNLAGTGLASFNDRFRDALVGGSPFGPPRYQGFSTGLATQPSSYMEVHEAWSYMHLMSGLMHAHWLASHLGQDDRFKGCRSSRPTNKAAAQASPPRPTATWRSASAFSLANVALNML